MATATATTSRERSRRARRRPRRAAEVRRRAAARMRPGRGRRHAFGGGSRDSRRLDLGRRRRQGAGRRGLARGLGRALLPGRRRSGRRRPGHRLRVGLCGRGDRRGRDVDRPRRLARALPAVRRPGEPVRDQPEQLSALALSRRQDRLEVGGQGLRRRGRDRARDGVGQRLGGVVGAARRGAERAAHHLGQRRGQEGVVDRRRGGRGRLAQQALVEDRRHPAHVVGGRAAAGRPRAAEQRRAVVGHQQARRGHATVHQQVAVPRIAPRARPRARRRRPPRRAPPAPAAACGRRRAAYAARRRGGTPRPPPADPPTSRAPAPAGRSGGGPGRRPRRPA